MGIVVENWGLAYGYTAKLITMTNSNGASASLTTYGAALVKLIVKDKNNNPVDVVLGYDNLEGYLNGTSYQGAIAGRYANRIGGAQFSIGDNEYHLTKNDGNNTLHGGSWGYDKRVWKIYDTINGDNSQSAILRYTSPDGEENFPGKVSVYVMYTLTDNNELKIDYSAVSDADTILNLTNHAYFNLSGTTQSVFDTLLQINAAEYTPVDDALLPTGVASVKNTPFDFTVQRPIGQFIRSGMVNGYDHNYILGKPGVLREAAIAKSQESGITMTTSTDMPAVQLYTAGGLNETGKNDVKMNPFSGFCLETQFSPNTPNMPEFPSCLIKKNERYRYTTVYKFE